MSELSNMGMGEVPHELLPGLEDTTQVAYARDLLAYVQTIPDVPPNRTLSIEDRRFLNVYCVRARSSAVEEQGRSPLYRSDFIDPEFCDSAGTLIKKVTNNIERWYVSAYDPRARNMDPDTQKLSGEWELFHLNYMRQRREFQAAFMSALVTKTPIDAIVSAIGLQDDGQPITTPHWKPRTGQMQPTPEFLYDRTSWVTATLLSALALPSELCDASMKRYAVEQWALHADLGDPGVSYDIRELEKKAGSLIRLPWSMRSDGEMQAATHSYWRQNRVIVQYLGDSFHPRPDGWAALRQDRPKDYFQIVLLDTFSSTLKNGTLRRIAEVAAFPDEVKNIIFADDASFNTIYSDQPNGLGEPISLGDFLQSRGVGPETEELIIADQALRIGVLQRKLAEASRIAAELRAQVEELRGYKAIAEQQGLRLPLSNTDELMLRYGISPAIQNDVLGRVITAMRRHVNMQLHSDTGNASPEDLDKLQRANGDFDRILEARGLRTQGGDPGERA